MEADARRLSESDSPIGAEVIVLLVILGLVILFCTCVCFTVRCFTSQTKKGALWSHTIEGQRWLPQWRWGEVLPKLVYENEVSRDLPCGRV